MLVFRFRDSPEANVVTVVAICTDHRLSTYPLPVLTEPSTQLGHQSRTSPDEGDGVAASERTKSRAEPANDSSKVEGRKMCLCVCV